MWAKYRIFCDQTISNSWVWVGGWEGGPITVAWAAMCTERSTILGYRNGSGIAGCPSVCVCGCVGGWCAVVLWGWCWHGPLWVSWEFGGSLWSGILTHRALRQHYHCCIPPANALTHTHLEEHQSLTPSFKLELCFVLWHMAAMYFGPKDFTQLYTIKISHKKIIIYFLAILRHFQNRTGLFQIQLVDNFYLGSKICFFFSACHQLLSHHSFFQFELPQPWLVTLAQGIVCQVIVNCFNLD